MGMITEVTLAKKVLTHVIQDVFGQGIKKVVIHFSDDGARKRYEDLVHEVSLELQIHLPITCGTKRRKSGAESKHGILYGDVDDLGESLVIALDDEAATMSTLIHTAEAIRSDYPILGFYSAVIHGVFCDPAVELLERDDCPITRTYASDTIPFHNRPHLQTLISNGKLVVIPSAKDLANIIFFHHWSENIRNIR
jgi:phosphoribosylpyrophosphate synthetase